MLRVLWVFWMLRVLRVLRMRRAVPGRRWRLGRRLACHADSAPAVDLGRLVQIPQEAEGVQFVEPFHETNPSPQLPAVCHAWLSASAEVAAPTGVLGGSPGSGVLANWNFQDLLDVTMSLCRSQWHKVSHSY